MNAYVYAVLVDGVVRYIGKGSGKPLKRAGEHVRQANRLLRERAAGHRRRATRFIYRLAAAIAAGKLIEISVIANGLSHDEAFDIERLEIAGQKNLWNSDGGGLGGKEVGPAHRQKLSAAAKRRANRPGERERRRNLAIEFASSPEVRERYRQTMQRLQADPEFRRRAATGPVKAWADPVTRKRMEAGLAAGRTPESYTPDRMVHSQESRDRQASKMRARWANPEFRSMMIAKSKAGRGIVVD